MTPPWPGVEAEEAGTINYLPSLARQKSTTRMKFQELHEKKMETSWENNNKVASVTLKTGQDFRYRFSAPVSPRG